MVIFLQYFSVIIVLICGVSSFVSLRKHLLSSLLSLEYIMLGVFLLMSVSIGLMGGDNYFILFFLTLAACEGALGLGLLIAVVRSHGNDNFDSLNILQC